MKTNFKPGLTITFTVTVDAGRTVAFTDPASGSVLHVYATPALVEDIETACRNLIHAHADNGEDSVGARVDVRHKAPTLENQDVTITATVRDVKDRAVTFDVTATDGVDEICECTHERYVIDVGTLAKRLTAKAEKVKG